MRQTELHVRDEDGSLVEGISSKGVHHSREVNGAHVVCGVDGGIAEAQIRSVLGIGRTALWRTSLAYLQGGVEAAVFDVEREGRPPQYDTDAEARVTSTGLFGAAGGATSLDDRRARALGATGDWPEPGERRDGASDVKTDDLKLWRRLMWCIGTLSEEYRLRMYDLLALYAELLRISERVICIDEKSLQLLSHSRAPLPMALAHAHEGRLRVRPQGHDQLVRGDRAQGGQENGLGHGTRGQDRLRRLHRRPSHAHLRQGASRSRRAGQPEHPFPEVVRGRAGQTACRQAAAPGPVPPHPQARQLAEHGRDRDRHPHAPVPGSTHRQPAGAPARGRRLAIRPQHPSAHHRVEV